MADGEVIIDVDMDTKEAIGKAGKLKSNLMSAGKAIAVSFAAIGTAAAAGVVGAFKLADKAADLAEAQNVVRETFKASHDEILAWSKTMAESAGMSETTAVQYVGSMGAMLKSSGLAEDAAASMSKELVQLTGDMSSFYNLEHDEMWEKIRSGISGETEPLKQLGINMSVANLEAFALSEGITKSYNSMSQAEQTTLRYNYLMSVTADAQGDFGRTLGESFPNQLRVAKMQLESLGTTIGQEFLPVFLDSFKKINQGIKDQDWAAVGEGAADAITGVLQKFADMAPEFAEMAAELIASLAEGIMEGMPKIAEGITTLINRLVDKIIELAPKLIPAAVKTITTLVRGFIQALPQLAQAAITIILELIRALTQELPKLIPVAVQAVLELVNGLISNISLIVEAAIELALALFEGLVQAIPQIVAAIPQLVTALCTELANSIGLIIEAGVQLLMGLIEAIPVIVVEIAKAVPQIIGAIVTGLLEGIGAIFEAALSIFGIVVDGGRDAMKELDEAIDKNLVKAHSWNDAWQEASATLGDLSTIMSDQGKTMSEVNSEIDDAQSAINRILSQAAGERRNLREDELKEIAGYNKRIAELQDQQLQIFIRQQNAALVKAKLEGASLTKEAAAALMKEAKAGYDQVVKYADEVYANRIIELEQEKNSIIERYGEEHYQKLLEQAKQDHDDRVEAARKTRDETLAVVQEGGAQWISAEEGLLGELGRLAGERKELNDQILESEKGTVNGVNVQRDLLKGNLKRNQRETAEILTDMITDNESAAIDTINAWMQMEAGIVEQGGEITEDAKLTAEGILGAFEDLPDDMQDQGRTVLLALAEGLEDKIPALKNAANMTTDELLSALRKYFGITGNTSTKTKPIGEALGQGLDVGFEEKLRNMTRKVAELTRKLIEVIQKASNIHSPSDDTIWMGEMLAAGVGVGYEKQIKKTMRDIRNLTGAEIARLQTSVTMGRAQAELAAGTSHTYAPNYNIVANQPIGQREILQQIQLDQQRQRLYAL
jgi:hypothetical protein